MTTYETPRVWIGCLAAYNGGRLHGEWTDATNIDELHEARAEVLGTSPVPGAEEAFIADYDGFGNLSRDLGEYPEFETLARVGALIEEHGSAFLAYISACEVDLQDDSLGERFEDAQRGEWSSEEDYAVYFVCEYGWAGIEQISDKLLPYLDMEMITRELFRHGTYVSAPTPEFQVYVFETDL